MHGSTHHEVNLDFQLDVTAPHQKFGFAGVHRCNLYASEIPALPPRQIRPGISLGSVNAQLPENRSIDML